MTDWIQRQRDAAQVEAGTDPQPYLATIESWREECRRMADRGGYEAVGRAVDENPPTGREARAIFCLYAIHAETVFYTAEDLAENTGAVSMQDLLQEAYPSYQRILVSYDAERGELGQYVANALRAYLRGYVNEMGHESVHEQDQVPPVRESVKAEPNYESSSTTDFVAPGFDVAQIYEELYQEGRLTSEAESLWEQVSP